MSGVQIWGTKGSTCTDRTLFTAGELNVPITYHHVEMSTGQHKQPEHLKRQPFGKVPAADIQGVQLYESRAIARTIARSSPAGEKLFPSSDIARVASFEQWASLESGTITPVFEKVVSQRIFGPQFYNTPTDEEAVKKAMNDGETALKVLNDQLTAHQFVAGDDFTLVDIFMSTYFNYFSGTPEGKQVLEQYSGIAQWWQRVSSRPAWQKVKSEQWQGK